MYANVYRYSSLWYTEYFIPHDKSSARFYAHCPKNSTLNGLVILTDADYGIDYRYYIDGEVYIDISYRNQMHKFYVVFATYRLGYRVYRIELDIGQYLTIESMLKIAQFLGYRGITTEKVKLHIE